MPFKQQLAKATGLRPGIIPNGYQVIGDIMLLKLPKAKENEKKKIAEATMKLLPYVKAVCEMKQINGEFREPKVALLAGSRTETIHTENGIKYHLDVSKVMFSKGNLEERRRLIPKIKEGETVVDMFAGIGYFSLPAALHTRAKRIVAIEKNLDAFRFLQNNIKLNSAGRIEAIYGDCRDFAKSVSGFANRIIMGYLPHTEEFLPHALTIARSGGIVHFHNLCSRRGIWKKPVEQIEQACRQEGCSFRILEKRKVKSYKPNVFHVVVDFEVLKA